LLKHSFFKKAGDTGFLAQTLLGKLEDIGESSMTAGIADALPGYVCHYGCDVVHQEMPYDSSSHCCLLFDFCALARVHCTPKA
jgi:hypothetical protein